MDAHDPDAGKDKQAIAQSLKQCIFSGTAEADLPAWFDKREPLE